MMSVEGGIKVTKAMRPPSSIDAAIINGSLNEDAEGEGERDRRMSVYFR